MSKDRLRQTGLPSPLDTRAGKATVKAAYLNWYMLPRGARVPSTKKAFAKQHGVSEPTLRKWELEEPFQMEIRRRRVTALADWDDEVFKRVREAAISPDGTAADRKQFLQLRGYALDGPDVFVYNDNRVIESPHLASDEDLMRVLVAELSEEASLDESQRSALEGRVREMLAPPKKKDITQIGRVTDVDYEVIDEAQSLPGASEEGSI